MESPAFALDICDNLIGWRINGVPFRYRGVLPFTKPAYVSHKPRKYTYMYASIGKHNFIVYDCSLHNINMALLRITGKRPGERTLRENNEILNPSEKNRGFKRFLESGFRQMKKNVEASLSLYCEFEKLERLIETATDKTHPKYKIRVQALEELLATREAFNNSHWCRQIDGKLKIPEFAKPGKKPRLLGDYSTKGSLLGCFVVPMIKAGMAVPVVINGQKFQYCYSTEPQYVDTIVSDLDRDGNDHFIYFSDDMIAKVNGEVFNIDISSCDQSNDTPVFNRLRWLVDGNKGGRGLITECIKQCLRPYKIRNPLVPREVVSAKPRRPIEFSGTVLTTLLNNIASFAIAMSIQYGRRRGRDIDQAAHAVGYIVTKDACRCPEDMQFLKLSFERDDVGSLRSWVNIGCLIRAIGSSWGDVPYKKSRETLVDALKSRARGVAMGFKHSGLELVLKPLLGSKLCTPSKLTPAYDLALRERQWKSSMSETQRKAVSVEALQARYRVGSDLIVDWLSMIGKADIGVFLSHPVVDAVYRRDYGATGLLPECPLVLTK